MNRQQQTDLDKVKQLKRSAEQAQRQYAEAKRGYVDKHISVNKLTVADKTVEWVKEITEDYEEAGYKALVASVVFAPKSRKAKDTQWKDGRVWDEYLNEEQARVICERVMREFDRMNGLRHGKQVDRIVAKQAGATGENWHWHATIFVDESWDIETVKNKYKAAVRKTKMKGSSGAYGDGQSYERVLLRESICEEINDSNTAIGHVVYSTHEQNKVSDSIEVVRRKSA